TKLKLNPHRNYGNHSNSNVHNTISPHNKGLRRIRRRRLSRANGFFRRRGGRISLLLRLHRRRRRRQRFRSRRENSQGKQHLVDLVNSKLVVLINGSRNRGIDDSRRDVDPAPFDRNVQRVVKGVTSLRPYRVAQSLEILERNERREDVVLDELDLLFGGEGVKGARFESRERAVCWGENGQAVGDVELVFDLDAHGGALEEADEDAEAAGLFEDSGDVGGGEEGFVGRRLDEWHLRWRLDRWQRRWGFSWG
ncbi:hypothetical protein PanWU01x14_198380, partial [Parasponia andersonii]